MKRSTLSEFYVTAIALSALSSSVFAGAEPVLSNRVIRAETPAEITRSAEPVPETTIVPAETVESCRPFHHEGLLLSKMQ